MTATLPECLEFVAPQTWRSIDFISDLHLCEAMPCTFDAWAGHLRYTSADAVFILGDLFELWVGDDMRTRAFEKRCVDTLAEASGRRHIGFMAGNRDFLLGSDTLRDSGMAALPDPTLLCAFGQRWLLSHGDALCVDDKPYQIFRAEVRSPDWQAQFLARPLAERLAIAA
ncbi:MAG TPA: UDP-2,3-diacylglucosamine diphosphatase, partial [Rubrivivax sp.]|nr:UDP-2,3-diacylglucosamine diphosphatase [Rubrivivax sp.]